MTDATALIIVAFILLIVGAIATWAVFFAISHAFERLGQVQRDVNDLKDRLIPKAPMTHKNAMTSENMMAQVIAAKRDLNEAQFMIDTLLKIMHEARENPNYNPELPVELQRQPSAYKEQGGVSG